MQKVTIDEWKALCKKHQRWCDYDFVKEVSCEEAESIIKNMPILEPQYEIAR